LIILLGKSGSGKDSIKSELVKMGLNSIVSYTTRPKREGEIEGVQYHYINDLEFEDLSTQEFFAETTSYQVANGDTWYYGSAKKDMTNSKVFIANPEGLKNIKKISELNPISFYISADEEILWNRLRERGDNSAEARRRLNADDNDFRDIVNDVDFTIKNNGDMSVKEIAECILYLYKRKIAYE
jgi:guanylate kinase